MSADQLGLRREDTYAVELVAAHAPAAPQISVYIDPEAIDSSGACVQEYAIVSQASSVVNDVKHPDQARHNQVFTDIQLRFVGTETESVRSIDLGGGDGGLSRLSIDAIDVERQLRPWPRCPRTS